MPNSVFVHGQFYNKNTVPIDIILENKLLKYIYVCKKKKEFIGLNIFIV